jgi:S-formylglutathione hydrolase FrmB
MGISMGGSGALQFAIGCALSGRSLDAVVLLSPAVFRAWLPSSSARLSILWPGLRNSGS